MNCSAYLVSQLQRQCCVFLAQTSTLTIVFDVISVHLNLLSNHVLHGNYTMVEIKPNQRNWPFVRIHAFLIFLMNAVIILFLAFQSKVHLFIKLMAQLGNIWCHGALTMLNLFQGVVGICGEFFCLCCWFSKILLFLTYVHFN